MCAYYDNLGQRSTPILQLVPNPDIPCLGRPWTPLHTPVAAHSPSLSPALSRAEAPFKGGGGVFKKKKNMYPPQQNKRRARESHTGLGQKGQRGMDVSMTDGAIQGWGPGDRRGDPTRGLMVAFNREPSDSERWAKCGEEGEGEMG